MTHIFYSNLHDLNFFTGKNHTTKLSWSKTNDKNSFVGTMTSFVKLKDNKITIEDITQITDDLVLVLKSRNVSQDDKLFFRFDNIILSLGNINFNLDKFVHDRVTQLLKYGYPEMSSLETKSFYDTIMNYNFPSINPEILTWETKYKKLITVLHKNFKHGSVNDVHYELEDTYHTNIEHSFTDYKLVNNVITKDLEVIFICPIKNQDAYDQHTINNIKTELRNKFISFKVTYM